MDFSLNRLTEIVEGLIDKHIRITFTSGDELTCILKEILPDALIVENIEGEPGKVGICSTSCIIMLLEGPFEDED